MNLRNFLVGLFPGHSANGELEEVKNAGRQDARLFVGTYLSAFEAEAADILTNRQQRFAGLVEDTEVLDAKVVAIADKPTTGKVAKKTTAKRKPPGKRGAKKA